jgi:pleckstrin homology-like domain family B
LCKEIILNSCSCRGYLSKQGARIRVWTRRWFVFDRNKRTLVYYRDKAESKAKGGIYFHAISEVYVDHQVPVLYCC